MYITDIKIDWSAGWANMPSIQVFLSKAPPYIDEIPHKRIHSDGVDLYYGERNGFVSYFCETSDKEGFGGHSFELLMEDGTKKTLVGPWSSRSSVMNAAFGVSCVEVTYDYIGNPYRNLKFAGAMAVNTVEKALAQFKPDIVLEEIKEHGEWKWLPRAKGKPGKWELEHGNCYGDPNYMPDSLIEEWNALAPAERGQRRFVS